MARRINGFERPVTLQLNLDAHVFDWFGGEFFRVQRIDIADETRIGREHLRVRKRDALVAVRLDGKNAHLEHIAVGVFHQRRVAHFAHDVLVNLPRLLRRQQLGLNLPPADVHRELVELRALGNGKQIRAFEPLRIRIVKILVHGRRGNLPVNLHFDVMKGNFQRREGIRSRPRPDRRTRPGRMPMRVVHHNEPVAQRRTHGGKDGQQSKKSFHAGLDGSTKRMLPFFSTVVR